VVPYNRDREIDTNFFFNFGCQSSIPHCEGPSCAGDDEFDDLSDGSDCGDAPSYSLSAWRRLIRCPGQNFRNAKAFRRALVMYCISLGYNFTYIHNEPKRVTVECAKATDPEVKCKWRLHASSTKKEEHFSIKTANLTHTCEIRMEKNDHPKAKKKWIADFVKARLRSTPNAKPSDLLKEIHQEFHVNVHYHRVWRGKEQARQEIHGRDEFSYGELIWYLEALEKSNPGSVTDLEVDPISHRFQRVFVSFYAWMEGFRRGCRPLIFIDGTFLKHKYKGVLHAATSLDANNELYTIAVGVSSAETNDNWDWFFRILRRSVPDDRVYTIYSDRNPSILNGVEAYFPESRHAYCLRHLEANFMKTVCFQIRSYCTLSKCYILQ
jgi:zinc finger SWIM domain-containing protein 3